MVFTSPRTAWLCACLMIVSCLGTSAQALEKVRVRISGLPEEAAEAMQSSLEQVSLSRKALDEEVTDPLTIFGAARADYTQMIRALYALGYYGPEISITLDGREAATIRSFELPQQVERIDIRVKPGRLFRFGTLNVAPRSDKADPDQPLAEGFETGAPALSELIGEAASTALDEWRAQGHARARVTGDDIIARHNEAALDVAVHLEPGPLLRFGEVHLVSETDIKPKRIMEILALPTGENTSPERYQRSLDRLRRVSAFRSVVLEEAAEPNPDGTLDYNLSVVDHLPRRYGVSAEYSSSQGIILGGFWMHRNVFGSAEQLRIDGEISGIQTASDSLGMTQGGTDYATSFRLTRPAAWGPDNAAFLFGTFEHVDEDDFLEQKATTGIGLNRWFHSKLVGEAAIGLRYSRVEDAFGDREFNHVTLPTNLTFDNRDIQGDPRYGAYAALDVTPLVGYNGSENFWQNRLDTRGYFSLANQKLTFAGRVQLGAIYGANTRDVPPEFLFFSGGGDTVRGQRFQSLGARELNGRLIGGRSFAGAGAELRGRVTDKLGLVGFYDFGRVGPGHWTDDTAENHSGAGIGLRYATPIGPVRVDIATPVEGPVAPASRLELYLGVGQAF